MVDPISESEIALGQPQRWNRYSYVLNNPVVRVDPDGRRDVYVAIWTPRFPYVFGKGSVGHVAVLETSGRVLLSEFPNPHGIRGKNVPLDYQATMRKEGGRNADVLYKVHVPNDSKFDAVVNQKQKAPTWVALPVSNNSTNCVESAATALKAGGVPVAPPTVGTFNLTPSGLISTLNTLIEIQKTSTEKRDWKVEQVVPSP